MLGITQALSSSSLLNHYQSYIPQIQIWLFKSQSKTKNKTKTKLHQFTIAIRKKNSNALLWHKRSIPYLLQLKFHIHTKVFTSTSKYHVLMFISTHVKIVTFAQKFPTPFSLFFKTAHSSPQVPYPEKNILVHSALMPHIHVSIRALCAVLHFISKW